MELGLAGRTVLVTGASKGIGLGVAQWFAREGCHLRLVARSGDLLAREGGRAEIVVETPMNLTKKQKELLQEFEAAGSAEKTSPEAAGFFTKVKELWTDLKS